MRTAAPYITADLASQSNSKWMKHIVLCGIIFLSFFCGMLIKAYAGSPQQEAVSIAAAAKPAEVQMIDVAPGDTLWKIANQYASKGTSVRSYIESIKQVNKLESDSLRIGQILRLP